MPRSPLLALALLATSLIGPVQADGPPFERRWVWIMANLLVDKEVDRVAALIERAGKAGYNGAVLSDTKFNILGRMPERYAQNVARVKAAAAKAKVEIIPSVFPIGYSNALLANDPNLAEGMLVERAPYVVKGREARLVPDPATKIINGGLEELRGDKFAGFGYQDEPGKVTVADREVKHGGKTSCRMQDMAATPVSRLIQSIKVRPHACYRLSCWAKTRDLKPTGPFRLVAIGASGRTLSFREGGVEPTQDWTRVDVVFNSQGESQINVYVGMWGGKLGTLWVDDLAIEEISLVNVLRRDGCPLVVASEDGKTTYVEGRDFEPVVDPKLGDVPYAGEYSFGHEGPAIRLKAGSRIKEGERLRVSWYHPSLVLAADTACCLAEPKVYDLLRDQARRIEELFHPRTVFMQHDELRVANWCKACLAKKVTAGQLLAENARKCTAILREVSPRATIVVWNDMFDPNHNAVRGPYYLVNGSLEGSWEGLDPSVVIMNWNGGKAGESLDFFAKRGHRQVIAGYYDDDDNFATWDAARKGVAGVDGFMYTTWAARFGDLERYGKLMTGAK
jgi:hypothetical protein